MKKMKWIVGKKWNGEVNKMKWRNENDEVKSLGKCKRWDEKIENMRLKR